MSFLVFGTGGDVGLVGGVGGGVRCRLCLGIFGCGCMTGCGAGVLIVWNGCFGCWYLCGCSDVSWLYRIGSSTGLGGRNSGRSNGRSSL